MASQTEKKPLLDSPVFFSSARSAETGYLSNFAAFKFTIDGITFKTVEHYFQYKKAEFQKNDKFMERILKAKTPGIAKKLGGGIPNLDSIAWHGICREVMHRGVAAKFQQNPDIKEKLISTRRRRLAEARKDGLWGIGVVAARAKKLSTDQWGSNWLGKILEAVRLEMMSAGAVKKDPEMTGK